MTNEAIERIREAEKSGAETVADARRRAAEIRANAVSDSAGLYNAAIAKAEEMKRSSAEEAKRSSDAVIDRGIDSARAEAKKTIASADGKIGDAADEIIREIFEKWQ